MDSENVRIVEVTKPPKKKGNLATVSLVLGILALVLVWLPPVSMILGVLAIIFGIVALVKKYSKGKSIVGMLLGVVSFVLAIIVAILSTILGIGALIRIGSWIDEKEEEQYREQLEDAVDVELGDFYFYEDEYGWIETNLEVVITNNSEETVWVSLEIAAIDSYGEVLYTGRVWSDELESWESVRYDAFWAVPDEVARELRYATFEIVEKDVIPRG